MPAILRCLTSIAVLACVWVKAPGESGPFPLAGFTVMLFLLYSKGWSPQFIAYVIPFLLFASGDVFGIACLAAISVVTFLEMPGWVIYAGGQGWAFPAAIFLARSVIFVLAAVHLARAAKRG